MQSDRFFNFSCKPSLEEEGKVKVTVEYACSDEFIFASVASLIPRLRIDPVELFLQICLNESIEH